MPAEIDTDTWDRLITKLKPSTHTDEDIEKVSVTLKNGGIVAKTIEPRPDVPEDDYEGDWVDVPSHEEVFIYEDFGIEIKEAVQNSLREAVASTPATASVQFREAIVDNEYIRPVFRISTLVPSDDTDLYSEFADALVSAEEIDSSEEFAYGVIDKCWYSEGEKISMEGWEFDGTLYKYTQEPYKWWAKGPDTDEPSDMESWIEFAADSEAEEEQIRNREQHVVHFHPMKRGLSSGHPFIRWYKLAENVMYDKIELTGSEESFRLTRVEIDESGAVLEGSLTV